MIISFNVNELKIKLGCSLMSNVFIEEVLVENYKYKRRDGLDYTFLLLDVFLDKAFQLKKDSVNSDSLISKDKLISITYSVLDKLDILLLMEIKDIIFKDILFKGKENELYNFEVMY